MKVERAVGTRRGASNAPYRVRRVQDNPALPQRLHRRPNVLCNLFLRHKYFIISSSPYHAT